MQFKLNQEKASRFNLLKLLIALVVNFIFGCLFVFYIKHLSIIWIAVLSVFLVLFFLNEMARFFNMRSIIKYQIIEVLSDRVITRHAMKNTTSVLKKDQFSLGTVCRKNNEIVSIGIKLPYTPGQLKYRYYENMDKLLECLQAIHK